MFWGFFCFTLTYGAYFEEQPASCAVLMFAERLYRCIAAMVFELLYESCISNKGKAGEGQ